MQGENTSGGSPTDTSSIIDRPLSRRRLFQWGGMAAAGAALAACGNDSSSSGGGGKVTVTMFLFAGTASVPLMKEFGTEYMAAHPNVNIQYYENSNTLGYPKMVAARQTTPDKPLVNLGFFNAQTSAQGDRDGMWVANDYDGMSNAADVLPILKRDNKNGIGLSTDSIGVVYNTDRVTPAPTSWADVWDPKYRGKVAFADKHWQIVYAYTMANGGKIDDLTAGWDFWKANAKQIRVIASSNDQYQSVMADGTAVMGSYFNGTVQQWRKNGAPIGYAPPAEGGLSVPSYLQLVAGSSEAQLEVSRDIINELISPKWCARYANATVTVPGNTKATLDADLAGLPAFQEAAVNKLVELDWSVVASSVADWNTRWDQDVKANI